MRDEENVELPKDFIRRVDIHIAEETSLFRSVKFAGVVFSALLGVMVWVFAEKNADIRAMQQTLNQHSMQISETLILLKSDVENGKRDRDMVEKRLDAVVERINGSRR